MWMSKCGKACGEKIEFIWDCSCKKVSLWYMIVANQSDIFMEEIMIDFEEELKHFQPSDEIEDAENAIYEHDITDMTDIMQQMMSELKRK